MIFQYLGASVLILLGVAGAISALRTQGPKRRHDLLIGVAKMALGLAWLTWTVLLATGTLS
jgi:hypothetical protein